jgi:hypothetical protein
MLPKNDTHKGRRAYRRFPHAAWVMIPAALAFSCEWSSLRGQQERGKRFPPDHPDRAYLFGEMTP